MTQTEDKTINLNAHNKEEFRPAHTAEHIINRTMDNTFHCGRAVEAHIERKKSKLDFSLPQEPDDALVANVEQVVNEVIDRHLPVTFSFISQADAASEFDLKRLPDGASETVRVVSIGDYDRCLCIGQHVANTAEIGHVRFISHDYDAERKILRIRFKIVDTPTA